MDDLQKARVMNEFFMNKVIRLQSKVNNRRQQSPLRYIHKLPSGREGFHFEEVREQEVLHVMKKMKKSYASGIDGISSRLMRPLLGTISPLLTALINESFKEGVFPAEFKCAKVFWDYKGKGSRKDKNNYRRISNLSFFSKVLEVIVETQLRKYCEKSFQLGANQHGFRSKRSTTTSLLSATIRWRESLLRGKYSAALIFDLSAAYDLVDGDILLKRWKLMELMDGVMLAQKLLGRQTSCRSGTRTV